MNTDSFSINSFLSITENKVDYKSILNKIKDDNLSEFLELKDNINIVQEIICELKEKEKEIEGELKYLDNMQYNIIQLFSEITRKNIKVP
jgi:hypothetical protein